MNVAERGKPDQFTQRPEVFCRQRIEHFFIADEISLFAVIARNIESVVKPDL
jgi:hypothetical protein